MDNCSSPCGPQLSFGTVFLDDTPVNAVTVTITLVNGNKFVQTGKDGVVGFNLIGINNATISGETAGFDALAYGPYTGFNGFGTFEYSVYGTLGNGGGNAVTGPLTFTVAASGITAQSFLEYSTSGADRAYVTVDILSGTTGQTGLVGASGPPVTVPEGGSTAALLGSVLLGVGMLRRRFGRS